MSERDPENERRGKQRITPKRAAELLRVCVQTVTRLLREEEELPPENRTFGAVRIGKQWRICPFAFRRFIDGWRSSDA
jgi:hypothetical protein